MKDTLKYLRMQNEFSQNKVADYLGISRQMYIKYESGETEPTVKCVRELSKLYRVSYDVLIDDKYKTEGDYTASNVNADALNFRQAWGLLFKLNSEDLIRLATRALKLVEEKKRKPAKETPEMSMEEKLRLFHKLSGCIKDVKIEDWKSEKMKYLEEKYGL